MKSFPKILLLAPLLLASGHRLLAQSTANLTGTVTDPTGAVVPNAAISIRQLATGTERDTTSDGSGAFNAPSLQPGDYTITVIAPGFSKFSVPRLTLEVNANARIDAKLGLQSAGETIQVESGGAAVIEATTPTVGQVIDRETVQQIPLNGRHFLDLTNLTPGTVVPPNNGSLTAPSRGLGANSFVTAGNREDTNNFQINGINLNDMTQSQITFQPSINTTSEFKIINSTFSAEFGRSSGAIVNVSTRSGTNAFHGEGFDYLRNNYFDARNFFNRAPGRQNQLNRHNFGGAFSGPVFKDRTFFFLSYEGLRQKQAILLTSNVPTMAQRAAFATSPAGPQWAQIINLLPIGAETTTNGVTTAVATGSSPGPVKTDQFSGDLFHNITKVDTLHLYYAWQQDARTEPNLQGNNVSAFGDHRTAHRQIGTINEIHVFSPSVVNEARIGFNRIAISFNANYLAASSTYGISNGVSAPLGIPQISVTDLNLNFGGPSGFPQGRFVTTGVFSDTLNYLVGKHSIKIGGEFRRFEGNNFSETPGTINFTTTANFINGLANTFSGNASNVVSRIFDSAAAGFLQDNWKVTPRLTAELGVRFEWNGTFSEGAHRFVNFLPATDTLQQVNQPYNQNYNFDPRLGFTFDAFGTGKTVLRGGFGILADQPNEGVVSGLTGNPPNSTPVSLTGGNLPIGTLYTRAAVSGLSPASTNPNYRNAYTESYNLNVQQDVGFGTVLQVGYIGSGGRHLRIPLNLNQFTYPVGTTAVRPFPTLSAASAFRPNAALGNISQVNFASMSSYNALWVTARKSLRGGVELNTSYTLAKSLDDNSLSGNGVQNSTNPAGDYGRSDFDTRHHFVFSGIWNLPFHGNRFKEGWLLANITQAQSGNPLNVTTSNTSFTGSGNIRPTVLGAYSTSRGAILPSGNIPFINAAVCTTPTAGCSFYTQSFGFGNLSRNALRGPDFSDVDLSLQKTTRLAESVALVLRLDSFDLLNHVNFANPNLTASTTGTFGQINATRNQVGDAGSSRQLQFAGKITF